MTRLARLRTHELSYKETDLRWRKELTGALAGTLGELTQQIFVSAPKEIGLYVGQPEAVARIGEGFHDTA